MFWWSLWLVGQQYEKVEHTRPEELRAWLLDILTRGKFDHWPAEARIDGRELTPLPGTSIRASSQHAHIASHSLLSVWSLPLEMLRTLAADAERTRSGKPASKIEERDFAPVDDDAGSVQDRRLCCLHTDTGFTVLSFSCFHARPDDEREHPFHINPPSVPSSFPPAPATRATTTAPQQERDRTTPHDGDKSSTKPGPPSMFDGPPAATVSDDGGELDLFGPFPHQFHWSPEQSVRVYLGARPHGAAGKDGAFWTSSLVGIQVEKGLDRDTYFLVGIIPHPSITDQVLGLLSLLPPDPSLARRRFLLPPRRRLPRTPRRPCPRCLHPWLHSWHPASGRSRRRRQGGRSRATAAPAGSRRRRSSSLPGARSALRPCALSSP